MTDGWHKQRMAIFDTETTGPIPDGARLVTACIGSVSGGLDSQVFQTLVNPGVDIPEGATAVHGITTEHAREHGRPPAEVVQELVDWIDDVWRQGMPLVAYNASYDLTVLDRESRRHLGRPFEVNGPVIDPFVIDRQVDKFRKGKRTLTVTCEHYGVRLDGAHDANEDALAAGRVAWAIAQRYPDIAAMPLGLLHEAQRGWHAERQRDFADYLRRVGKPADDVCEDWPMRYRAEVAA